MSLLDDYDYNSITDIRDDIFYQMEIEMELASSVLADLMHYIVNTEDPEGPENNEIWSVYNQVWGARHAILNIKQASEIKQIKKTIEEGRSYYNALIQQGDSK